MTYYIYVCVIYIDIYQIYLQLHIYISIYIYTVQTPERSFPGTHERHAQLPPRLAAHRLVAPAGAEDSAAGGLPNGDAVLVEQPVGAALVAIGVVHLLMKLR